MKTCFTCESKNLTSNNIGPYCSLLCMQLGETNIDSMNYICDFHKPSNKEKDELIEESKFRKVNK